MFGFWILDFGTPTERVRERIGMMHGINATNRTNGTNGFATFLIPHSSFLIPHSVFPIPYSVFPIPYSVFRIPYSVFTIPHSPLGSPCLDPKSSGYLMRSRWHQPAAQLGQATVSPSTIPCQAALQVPPIADRGQFLLQPGQ